MSDEKVYTLKELEKDLNEAQKKCCKEYVLSWKKAKSYMKAYPDSSYEAAAVSMHNLLKNPKILQYIEYIKKDIENTTGVSKIRNVSELAKIAYSSIAMLHDCWIELADWERIKENNPDALDAIETIDTKTEHRVFNREGEEEAETEIKYVKIKLHPKVPAIQEINRMMGYNAPEKHEHDVDTQVIILPSNNRDNAND